MNVITKYYILLLILILKNLKYFYFRNQKKFNNYNNLPYKVKIE